MQLLSPSRALHVESWPFFSLQAARLAWSDLCRAGARQSHEGWVRGGKRPANYQHIGSIFLSSTRSPHVLAETIWIKRITRMRLKSKHTACHIWSSFCLTYSYMNLQTKHMTGLLVTGGASISMSAGTSQRTIHIGEKLRLFCNQPRNQQLTDQEFVFVQLRWPDSSPCDRTNYLEATLWETFENPGVDEFPAANQHVGASTFKLEVLRHEEL